jgi:hypothetical protein
VGKFDHGVHDIVILNIPLSLVLGRMLGHTQQKCSEAIARLRLIARLEVPDSIRAVCPQTRSF